MDYFSNPQYCPGGSIFDPESLTCVLNENAPCSRKVNFFKNTFGSFITELNLPFSSAGGKPPTPTPTTPAGPFVCLAAGTYPYPGNCSLYYICTAADANPLTVVSNF